MKSVAQNDTASGDWADPGYFLQQSRARNALRLFIQLFQPPKGHKVRPTPAGIVLILLALGIGTAAYNTSSNILFIALALMLSCLLLSGILSWINFKGTRWRLLTESHLRVGETAPVRIDLFNDKRLLPTYCLWFNVKAITSQAGGRTYLTERLEAGKGQGTGGR